MADALVVPLGPVVPSLQRRNTQRAIVPFR
jgi:hypothetical protein